MKKNRADLHHPLSHWWLSHVRAARAALVDMCHAPITNIITICIIGIAIALPLGLFTVLENLKYVNGQWGAATPNISLYLKTGITSAQANDIIKDLKKNDRIQKVSYISPEEGLASFKNNSSISNVAQLLQNNPLPGIITISPTKENQTPEAMDDLYVTLKQLPLVDNAQLDRDWIMRLLNVISIGKNITNALSLLFGFGVVLIIGHALRASLENHLKEIQVMRLMGAANSFIRSPLVCRGVLYGLMGGAIAWIAVNIFVSQLQTPVSQFAQTYQVAFQLKSVSVTEGCALLGGCAVLGFMTAWIIITQFLSQPEHLD